MRCLIQVPEATRHRSVAEGWKRALEKAGHTVHLWESEAVFDVFSETDPHFFVVTREVSRGLAKCLAARPHLKVSDQRNFVPAFDSLRFTPGVWRQHLACDVCFVGDYRPAKRALIDRYLSPLFKAKLKIRLFGPTSFGVAEYCGPIKDETLADLYASASVCLDISNSRAPERVYQIYGLGGLGFGSMRYTFPELEPNGLREPDEFACGVDSWLDWGWDPDPDARDHDEVRKDHIAFNQKTILEHHTYLHRVIEMLQAAGLSQESTPATCGPGLLAEPGVAGETA